MVIVKDTAGDGLEGKMFSRRGFIDGGGGPRGVIRGGGGVYLYYFIFIHYFLFFKKN